MLAPKTTTGSAMAATAKIVFRKVKALSSIGRVIKGSESRSDIKEHECFQIKIDKLIRMMEPTITKEAYWFGVASCGIVATPSMKPTKLASTGTSRKLDHNAFPVSADSMNFFKMRKSRIPISESAIVIGRIQLEFSFAFTNIDQHVSRIMLRPSA